MKQSFEDLVNVLKKLRTPRGCHWDREQTIETMKDDILGEAQEVAEAIDKKDYKNLEEELGDLLWTVIMIINIADEKGLFKMEEVLEKTKKKVIRRHPHVFGKVKAKNAEEAEKMFLEAKAKEKK
ncbi:MAG: nucleotide pyrophosphohydrolase [Nanoarchaeota archaeon]|nr:nucleotide pyrophosphohydrolase [Nanoarchaeota archaeon]